MSLNYPDQQLPQKLFDDNELRPFFLNLVNAVTLLVDNLEKAHGLYGQTGVEQGAALTTALTSITHTEPGTPDYAIQDLTTTTPYGFVSQDEGNTVLKVILNLQTRVNELEARLDSSTGIGVFE